MVSVDAAECGELVRARGRPIDPRRTPSRPRLNARVVKARRRARAGDGHVVIDGGQYTLFGAETAKLPKVAWDDGCVVCGGDVNAGVVLLCEGCDSEYRLRVPLAAASPPSPEGEWFCPRARARAADDDDEARTPADAATGTSTARFAALEGTALRAVAAGAEGGGSTRAAEPTGVRQRTRDTTDAARRVAPAESPSNDWRRCWS